MVIVVGQDDTTDAVVSTRGQGAGNTGFAMNLIPPSTLYIFLLFLLCQWQAGLGVANLGVDMGPVKRLDGGISFLAQRFNIWTEDYLVRHTYIRKYDYEYSMLVSFSSCFHFRCQSCTQWFVWLVRLLLVHH